MWSLSDQSNADYKLIFKCIQGIKEESEFYKTVYDLILSCLKKSTRYLTQLENYLEQKKISEISTTGVKLEEQEIDYLVKINQLVSKLDSNGEKIIILLDELPDVLYKLYKKEKGEDAANILKNLREAENIFTIGKNDCRNICPKTILNL
jgi:hypothetical protein